MPRSNRILVRYGSLGAFLLLILTISVSASPVVLAASDPPPLFLPVVLNAYEPPAPASSFELIDTALKAGQISAETALEYKAFTIFGDSRLPAAYLSADVGGEGDLFMQDVVAAYPTLSSQAKAILTPFFTPPYQAGSWAAQSVQAQAASSSGDWAYLNAAGGKARVWYKKGDATMQQKAGVVAAAINNVIWKKETDLMGRAPIPDGAGVQNFVVADHYRNGWNSTFVPFGQYAGMTVPQTCSQTASIIYINPSLPDSGNATTIGLVETTAHEFMHALQFSFPLAVNPCREYAWMAEATATWAEDFVYPSHNTEQRMAKSYLDLMYLQLNDTYGWRQYGEYMLVYYFTKKNDDPEAVRHAWAAAGYMDSYQSFYTLGGLNYDQVAALWNQEPFGTFFKDNDGLTKSPKADVDVTLKADGGFKQYDMNDYMRSGGVRFLDYKVDPSVHTITFLDGLTTKITAGPYNGLEDDTVYNQDGDVPEDDRKGAEEVVLVKYQNQDEVYTALNPGRMDFCQDWLDQKVSEILVVIANNDLTDRNHEINHTGVSSKILVSSVPCVKLQGSASITTKFSGVTETLSATGLEYEYESFDPSWDYRVNLIGADYIHMRLVGGSWSWHIGGTDANNCTYSGSDSGSITQDNNGSAITLYFSLLPGSQRYLAYEGTGGPDEGTEVTTKIKCPHQAASDDTNTLYNFFMPDGKTPIGSDGALKGSKTDDAGEGISTQWDWNFQAATE
jgi:hypothetical protein